MKSEMRAANDELREIKRLKFVKQISNKNSENGNLDDAMPCWPSALYYFFRCPHARSSPPGE